MLPVVGAARTRPMRESVIRDMTRLAVEHGAVNLSQGFPDFAPPSVITDAAKAAIDRGDNQYSNPWGDPGLRERLARLYTERLGWAVDPNVHVTVTCGVTEALSSAVLALVEPGDEVLILEPAHDNYWPVVHMAGAVPVSVALEAPDYRLPVERIASVITKRTRAILFNTPHNPTGRVFDEDEVAALAELAERHDLIVITDEIYDRIVFDGLEHRCPGALESLRDRTVTISGLGKTFAVTGWRLGYVIAPDRFARAVRVVHDFATICAPTPLQIAAAAALDLPEAYFDSLVAEYDGRRNRLLPALREVGFDAVQPQGAYYSLASFSGLNVEQSALGATDFARWMTIEVGVAVVPGDAAFTLQGYGTDTVRFAFCKKLATLDAAIDRITGAFA